MTEQAEQAAMRAVEEQQGLRRIEALSGRFELASPPGAGTLLRAELPTSA